MPGDPSKSLSPEDILVGGQAVIEGVMMRTPYAYAVAVRRADGSLEVKKEGVRRLSQMWKPLSWPVIRGFAVLLQSLVLGLRSLNFSFSAAMADADPAAAERARTKRGDSEWFPVVLSIGGAAAVAVLLFILAPLGIATWLKGYFAAVHNWVVFNLVDGVIRLVFFLGYILLISRMRDIRRVFEYHGAEHKVVYTWEAAEDLTVENARRKSRLHPRCGTSFLMFVMAVSIIVFSLFKFHAFWAIFLSRVVLVPLISGLSYELIRLSAPRCQRGAFRVLVGPGLLLQRITTAEPSDDQLEVAIHALREALELDSRKAREAAAA
ncbi:MAG: DUF1385 domain-containing protein [Acidobacteria bacterium]|nr:MAG: DUF1385 domain-containing protein [Acidobacteriota bacterium]